MMLKLKAHGIDGRVDAVADWISDWLDNRMQRVCSLQIQYYPTRGWSRVEFHRDPCWVHCCFSFFINDLDLGLLSSIHKFADDTKVFGKTATPTDFSYN